MQPKRSLNARLGHFKVRIEEHPGFVEKMSFGGKKSSSVHDFKSNVTSASSNIDIASSKL